MITLCLSPGYNQQTGQQRDFPGPYVQLEQEYYPLLELESEPRAPQPKKPAPPTPPVQKHTPSTSATTKNRQHQPLSEQHYPEEKLDTEPESPEETVQLSTMLTHVLLKET